MMQSTKPIRLIEPIVYTYSMPIRFDDLDPYGHVNAGRYLDLIASSRFHFAAKHQGLDSATLAERRCGWFLKHVDYTYRRPIVGTCSVVVNSWLKEVPHDSRFEVMFNIKDEHDSKVHAEGRLTYVTIDLATNKPSPLPDWLLPYFFVMPQGTL